MRARYDCDINDVVLAVVAGALSNWLMSRGVGGVSDRDGPGDGAAVGLRRSGSTTRPVPVR